MKTEGKIRRTWPWIFVPLYLAGVYICAVRWKEAGTGTALFVTAVMAVTLAGVRVLLRRDGLCRDASSSAFFLLPFCALILARLSMFDYVTLDYVDFLHPWVERLRESGGLAGLSEPVGNYNVPYLTWLALFTYIPVHDLYLIKLLSVLFDVLLAYFLFKIAGELTDDPTARLMCFLLTLVLPTPFLNSAVWGQCDSSYAAFCAGALYYGIRIPKRMQLREHYMRTNSVMCCILAALALGYKLQAVFIMPILIPLVMARRLSLKYIWVFPVTYMVIIMPALLAGRDFAETLMFYFSEYGSIGDGLNYNSPSMFALRSVWNNPELWGQLGIVFSVSVCVLTVYLAAIRRKQLNSYLLVLLGAILCVGVPLFLPHMHDRYFYLADVMILPLAVKRPKLSIAVVLSGFASILGYHAYLRMQWLLTMNFGFYALAITLIILVWFYMHESKKIKL